MRLRRSLIAQLVIFAVVTLVATTHTLVTYARVGADLFHPAYRVSVELADAGGLFEHAEVTYRGVEVGRVERLALGRAGARAVLRLDPGIRVPRQGLLAVVANRSAVGEQYLDLRPDGTAPPYLREGDVIAREQTRLPVTTAQLLGDVDRLLASVDTRDVATLTRELERAFGETGPHLRRLLDASDELLAGAREVLPETVTLIGEGEKVLDTQLATGGHLRAFSRDLAELTTSLRAGRRDLSGVIDGAAPAARATGRLVDELAPHLPTLLANLGVGGQVVSARVPALRQLLIGYPAGVAGAFSVMDREGGLHFGLNLNLNVPPPCRKGYETRRRLPQDTSVRAARLDSRCEEPRDSETGVRGSRNAPAPLPTPTVSGLEEWQKKIYAPGYDPAVGRVRGDQARGDTAWQALLLGPLGS